MIASGHAEGSRLCVTVHSEGRRVDRTFRMAQLLSQSDPWRVLCELIDAMRKACERGAIEARCDPHILDPKRQVCSLCNREATDIQENPALWQQFVGVAP